jgi:hypothetical protein
MCKQLGIGIKTTEKFSFTKELGIRLYEVEEKRGREEERRREVMKPLVV